MSDRFHVKENYCLPLAASIIQLESNSNSDMTLQGAVVETKFENQTEKWRCFFHHDRSKSVSTPLFVFHRLAPVTPSSSIVLKNDLLLLRIPLQRCRRAVWQCADRLRWGQS